MTLDYFTVPRQIGLPSTASPRRCLRMNGSSHLAEAKILYGILLDRMSLSRKRLAGRTGRVFIIFTLDEVMEAIVCRSEGNQTSE